MEKYYLGDTHSIIALKSRLEAVKDNSEIIHVGDVGIVLDTDNESFKTFLKNMNKELKKRNIIFKCIRGNHDNPDWWKDDSFSLSNFKFIPDYTVEDTTLYIGGAISIDRLYRILEQDYWWADEKIVYKDCTKLKNITTIVSHNCPSFAPPYGFSKTVNDFIDFEKRTHYKGDLGVELMEERKILDKVYGELSFNNEIVEWVHGHMHRSQTSLYGNVKIISLGINELYRKE